MSQKFIYVDSAGDYVESVGAYESGDFVVSSAGVADAAKPIILDAGGKLDASFIDESDIDHDSITNNGSNDHAAIDTHIGDGTLHFTEGSIDHGNLNAGSLGDDDHTIYTLADGTRAFSGNQSMGSNKITSLSNGTDANDAVNKSQLDAAVTGISWREPVHTINMIADNIATPPGSPADCDSYIMPGGALTGAWSSFVQGNLVVWDDGASSWVRPHGTSDFEATSGLRVVVDDSPDGGSSFSANASEIAVTDGVGGWTFVSPSDGWSVLVHDHATPGPCDSTGWVYDTNTTPKWVQFTGAGQINAGDGLTKAGNTLNVGAGDGITVNNDDIEVALAAAGGLVIDTAEVAIDWSTAFNDAKAIKAEDLNSTTNGEGASIVGLEDTGGYFTTDNAEAALQELGAAIAGGVGGVDYTAGAGGVTKGDLVYVSAANTVLPYNDITAAQAVIGVAATTQSVGQTVKVLANDTIIDGYSSLSPGAKYYWNGDGTSNAMAAGWVSTFGSFETSEYVWLGGVAKNTTSVHVEVMFIRKTSAS